MGGEGAPPPGQAADSDVLEDDVPDDELPDDAAPESLEDVVLGVLAGLDAAPPAEDRLSVR